MALVFVLWVMVILSAVALEMRFSSHLRIQVTANMGASTKALYLARAGVERAVADVDEGRDAVQALADLREGDSRTYANVALGDGAYTLYAGIDTTGNPVYGLVDEAAKIDVNKAERSSLARVPGLDADLAAAIEALRKEEELRELDGLLILEGMDLLTLYGEDQNQNGLLDPNEDDGDESWPPDNADGMLDGGVSAWLTVWSAARNVTAEGEKRADLSKAGAEELQENLPGISSQQADSIVAHRQKGKFSSIADLLDIDLVEKVAKDEKDGQGKEGERDRRPPQNGPPPNEGAKEQPEGEKQGKEADDSPKEGDGPSDDKDQQGKPPEGEQQSQESQETYKSTGQKAFDMATFRRVADFVTTSEDEVLRGLVNVNTAPYEVLACVEDMDEAVARAIVRERATRPEGFTSIADLLDVEGVSESVFKKLCGRLSVRSDVFSVRSFGVVEPDGAYCCVMAVIDRTEDELRLRRWRELE